MRVICTCQRNGSTTWSFIAVSLSFSCALLSTLLGFNFNSSFLLSTATVWATGSPLAPFTIDGTMFQIATFDWTSGTVSSAVWAIRQTQAAKWRSPRQHRPRHTSQLHTLISIAIKTIWKIFVHCIGLYITYHVFIRRCRCCTKKLYFWTNTCHNVLFFKICVGWAVY